MISRDMALDLRQSFNVTGPISDDNLDRICEMLSIDIRPFPFPFLKELRVDHVLFVDASLSRDWRRWVIAHGIGHVLQHCGDQFRMSTLDLRKQERQANDFAGWLLCAPCWTACACEGEPADIEQLAEDAGVPIEHAATWVLSVRRELCSACANSRLVRVGG